MGSPSLFPHNHLGAAAAVLLLMASIFWGKAAKARRLAQSRAWALDPQKTDPSHSNIDEAELSNSGEDVRSPNIFLSHSGKQKSFVEHLYDALRSAGHSAFFDQHCLPKGFPFPPRIKQAASNCKIGVVVVSEDFFISKWPMIELHILMSQRGPDACVLPLFYKLRPEDLKSAKNLSEWRRVWRKKAGEHAHEWEQAVKALNSFNGEVYVQGTSEVAYIKKVIHRICSLIPCDTPYDISTIQGHFRLAQEVEMKFGHLNARQACVVGVHGVGGLGKTTLCKIMVNHYSSRYLGRSFLIEFPSDGRDKMMIVEECKKALKKLTNLNNEHLLNEVGSFDQVVRLMKERLRHHDVFLAVDNVWEGSLEEAERVLEVGFSANSRILVTSRSEQVLKDLLTIRGHVSNASVAPLPALECEEAFQIFLNISNLGVLNSLVVDRRQMNGVLERCSFSGEYHALALKALGQYVRSVCVYGDSKEVKRQLSCILEEISNADLSNLEDVIRLSYDNLPELKKRIFLDIAVLLRENGDAHFPYAGAREWISMLYGKFPKSKITLLMHQLALDGLIQVEDNKDGEKCIRIHDLFHDLAWREAASSCRFYIGSMVQSVEKIEWEMLETVLLEGDEKAPFFMEKLQQHNCRKLRLLCARDIETRIGIQLDSMPSLFVLILERVRFVENEHGSASSGSSVGIEDVELSHEPLEASEDVPDMSSLLEELTVNTSRAGVTARVEGVHASSVINLNGFHQLHTLLLESCHFVEEIAGLNALRNLQKLSVRTCDRLKNLDGLSGLIRLRDVEVGYCRSLKRMADVSSLTCLEMLELYWNEAMEEVGGEYLPCALKHLVLRGCRSIKSFPSWDKCMHMETLSIDMDCMKSFPSLPNLHELTLMGEDDDKWMCLDGEEWRCFTRLQKLTFYRCGSIKKVSLGGLPNLKELVVFQCQALEEMGNLSALHCLELLCISACPSLKKFDGISSTCLNTLSLDGCVSLQESSIPDTILTNTRTVSIRNCGKLKNQPV